MEILVTGGGGYIGSQTVIELLKAGNEVTVFDNLVYGHREAIPGVALIEGDLLNKSDIVEALKKERFDAVIHLAAYASVGESVKNPGKYFQNNVFGTLNLLEAMIERSINLMVFSSTCAVFGTPRSLPLSEDMEKNPESPYGESKLIVERILNWYDRIYGLKSIVLRYFNAAGAALDGSIGEDVRPPIRIIPNIMEAVLGKREAFTLNGDDFETHDGTCIRDYVHVLDLAAAHVLSLDYLMKSGKSDHFNLGVGSGASNREVIEMVKKVTAVDFKIVVGPRRNGDPTALYADNSKAKRLLRWEPKHSNLKTIVESAYLWHKTHPHGFNHA